MKNSLLLLTILLFISCTQPKISDAPIPWYINERIKTGEIENYNFRDSLNKYQSNVKISNHSKYKSYLTDLQYKLGIKDNYELLANLEEVFKLDSIEFCNKLIKPSLEYIQPSDRPFRRYSKPYIIDLDFDFFIDKCLVCGYIENKDSLQFEIGRLHLSHIMLKDQWYRIPHRTQRLSLQDQYDKENRIQIDALHKTNSLNLSDEETRSNVFALLLHSTDCVWTRKWLKIYFDNCSNYKKYTSDLEHFLWRSSCKDEITTAMVKTEIDRF